MWSFFRRQQIPSDASGRSKGAAVRPRLLKFGQILDGMGDFSDLKHHDAALKFWLPEAVDGALKEISKRNGDSLSEALRQFFAVHCYGLYAFQVMNDDFPGLFKDSSTLFSRRSDDPPPGKKRIDTYWVPELGKNTVPVKVWIPDRIRKDIQTLADHVGIKTSQYVREIVISRMLGHGMLPKRPEMLDAVPLPSAEDWCNGREVPFREATKDVYLQSTGGEIRTLWVDQ
jgi:hypothetical protein